MTSSRTPSTSLSRMSPDDAAAYWLARQDAHPAAATDAAFLAWLQASAANEAAWMRVQAAWRGAGEVLRDDPLAEALRASAMAARPVVWPKIAMAACAALVLVGAVVGAQAWSRRASGAAPVPTVVQAAPLQIATRTGERRAVTLTDGTQVELDSDTRVDVAFDAKARRLELRRGQAYIAVAQDAARPFAVDVGDQTIVDRGTEFSVRLDQGAVSVTLAEGGVAVGARGGPATHQLEPGQRLVLQAGRPAMLENVDLTAALAWRDGFVEFSDMSLSDAVAEMNRYGGHKMIIADPGVAPLKVSGRFKVGEPERFLRTVSLLLPLRVVQVGETLEIHAAPMASEAAP